jgi:hypothetical protein
MPFDVGIQENTKKHISLYKHSNPLVLATSYVQTTDHVTNVLYLNMRGNNGIKRVPNYRKSVSATEYSNKIICRIPRFAHWRLVSAYSVLYKVWRTFSKRWYQGFAEMWDPCWREKLISNQRFVALYWSHLQESKQPTITWFYQLFQSECSLY